VVGDVVVDGYFWVKVCFFGFYLSEVVVEYCFFYFEFGDVVL